MTSKVVAMSVGELSEVLAIEAQSHPRPWTEAMFREELEREWAYLDVVSADGVVVAFCNYWLVHDEVHLLNIATEREARRRGFGRQLLVHIIDFARSHQCRYVTLEVRKSNEAAQGLYRAEGFESVGLRPRYYADNKEDAVIMLLELTTEASPE